MDCSTPGFPILHHLLKFAQTHVHSVGDAIQLSHPLLPPFSSCLQSFQVSGSFPMSQFFQWSKYWSFSFSISPSYEYSWLIAFRVVSIDLVYLCFHCRLIKVHLQSMCFLPRFSPSFSCIFVFTIKSGTKSKHMGFPGGSLVKSMPANAGNTGDLCSVPGWRRFPEGGNGDPLYYSCLENPMDWGD